MSRLVENQEKQLIFYGTYCVKTNFDYLVSKGFVPVCFADNASKRRHSTIEKYGRRYEILPLSDAIKRYPNFELLLLVNPRWYDAIRKKLIRKGIAAERIKTLGPHSCRNIGQYFVYDGNGMGTCCTPEYAPPMLNTDDISYDVKKYTQICKELRDNLNSGKITRCTGCFNLEERPSNEDLQITRVNLGTGLLGGDRCNASCMYCTYGGEALKRPGQKAPTNKNIFQKALNAHRRGEIVLVWAIKRLIQKTIRMYNRTFKQQSNVLEVFRYLTRIPSVKFLAYACGEITISPYRDEILEYWKARKLKGNIVTNGFIYNEKISCLLEQGLISLNVSLDAGTKETFVKIKGVDCFGKVVENLEKYAQTGGLVELKYILLHGINTNEADVDNFLTVAKRINALVIISRDNRLATNNMSEEEYQMLLRIAYFCRKQSLKYITVAEYISSMDIQKLKSECIL